ncbi:MAG: hypothetical protein AAFQ94_01060 [Bacteroidota bacterium]
MILLELNGDALIGIIFLILFVMVGPSIILALIGLIFLKKKRSTAKVLFIIAGAYLLIAGGICGVLISG